MKTVKTYNSRIEAFGDKAVLEDEGIRASIASDDAGGMRPDVGMATGGVRLQVSEEDVKQAKEVLEIEN